MLKLRVPLLLVSLVLCLTAPSCKQPPGKDEIVIGAFGPITGNDDTFGISTKRGYEMAADFVNARGGLSSKAIRLRATLARDTAETVKVTLNRGRVTGTNDTLTNVTEES